VGDRRLLGTRGKDVSTMPKGKVWEPDTGSILASPNDNTRVRNMYLEEKLRRVLGEHELGCDCDECATFRGGFVTEWVMVAAKLGLTVPGTEARTPLRDETDSWDERKVDAARSRLRQFEAGRNEFRWVLVGIECVICERLGMALPPDAYQVQGVLDVD